MTAIQRCATVASLAVMLGLGDCTDASVEPHVPLVLANTSWISEQVNWVAAPPEMEHLYEANHREGVLDVLHFRADGTVLKIRAGFGDSDRSTHLWLMDGSGYVVDRGTWQREQEQLLLHFNIRFDHYLTYSIDSTYAVSDTLNVSPIDATLWRLSDEKWSFIIPDKAVEWSMIEKVIAP